MADETPGVPIEQAPVLPLTFLAGHTSDGRFGRTPAGTFASSAQGAKADSAVQPGRQFLAGTGLTGGGDLSADRTIGLDAASIASLALADTSLQPVETSRDVVWSDSTLSILDIPPFANDHRLNLVVNQVVPADFASANINRSSGITGGTTGSLNSTLRLLNNVFNSDPFNASTNPLGKGSGYDGKSYEWGLGVVTENGRNFLADGFRGQNGAAYFFGKKAVANAGGTWGINAVAVDYPGLVDPVDLVQAGEFDVQGDGTDANNVRLGVSSNMKSTTTVDGAPSGFGEGSFAFSAGSDPGFGGITSGAWFAKWKVGFYAYGPMDVAFDAADTSNALATTPYSTPVALRMSAEQKIAFSADKKFSLRFSNSVNSLRWNADPGSGASDVFALDGFGNVVFGFGTTTVVSGFTWNRVVNTTGSAALQLSGGNVDFRLTANNAVDAEIGTSSNHSIVFKQNSTEKARLASDGFHQMLSVSATPSANGDLVVQATSNTSLTFKYQGSDGTVRSASITLA